MSEKKISVVIPVHNSAGTLKDCLGSLFSNNYNNFEVIVVNDCSSDNSLDIAKGYHCKIADLSEQRGPAFARDRGLSLADGEIVAFLDSDCIAPNDWLAKINSKLTENIVGIGGKYNLPRTANGICSIIMTYWDLKNIFYQKPLSLTSLSGGNCAFWKSGLLRERKKIELMYCNKRVGGDDTIMCYELAKIGKLIYYPDISVVHNKKSSLLSTLKETINLGYSGAIVAGLCGVSLIKEPHRFYKSILYLLSLLLLFLTASLLFTKAWKPCLYFLLLYVTIQLPIIFLATKQMSRPNLALFFPATIFVSDLLCLVGHIKRGLHIIRRTIKSAVWHIKLLLNVINPLAVSRFFLFVTKRCNASCYFCFNKQYGQVGREEDLLLDEIKNISIKVGFLPWLTITGGEPFLRDDIYETCRLFYSNCNTRIISIATNGTLAARIADTAERLLIDCDQLYLTIIVALDDASDMHDKIKGIKGAYGQSIDTLRRLRILRSRFPRLTLGINTTIIKENADRIEEILDYFEDNLDCDRQCINLLRQGPYATGGSELISIQKYLTLVKTRTFPARASMRSNFLKQKLNHAILEYISDQSLKEFKQKKALDRCLAAQKFFVINNDGKVYACELLAKELGNLRREDYDFRKLKSNAEVKEIRSRIKNTNCYCQWPCAAATNRYFNIFWYPRIIKRAMQLLKD